MDKYFKKIQKEIMADPMNAEYTNQGFEPLFTGSPTSKIAIIGQAPGIRAQTSGIPWDDASGERLREWLGITSEQFYDEKLVALIPMDFYFPGNGKSGDLPPRKGFAEKWHHQLLEHIEGDPLIVLIGQYAQGYYLPEKEKTLTETVKNYKKYLGNNMFPLPHPSPRNNIWMARNPWFGKEVIPELRKFVRAKT